MLAYCQEVFKTKFMAKPDKRMMDENMSSNAPSGAIAKDACSMGDCCGGTCGCNGMRGGLCSCGASMYRRRTDGRFFLKLTAGLFFLMMAIWVAMQMFGNPWYKNIQAEFTNQPYARTITVEGEGKISAQPDIAKVDVSVVANGKTVKTVTEDGNKKMNAVRDAMKQLGIKLDDMQTSSYDLYPQYDYNMPIDRATGVAKPPMIIGYSLNQTLSLKVRDLTKTDEVLDRAIASGANQVGQLTFDLDDASQVKVQARAAAFKKAKQKAQEMASAAGVSLGRVVTFSESSNPIYPMAYANFAMKAESGDASISPSVEPGTKELLVNVSVTYEIE